VESARLFPPQAGDDAEVLALLNFFILEKALYELEYERNNRPDWVAIPLGGLKALAL
jgi:maltose alpha-D-glucosyltransferase/alpha-amylase